MKYIVTGSSGFIGSHIVDLLKQKRKKYLCIDKLNSYKIENYLKSDLTDLKKLEKNINKNDVVLHFAGMSDIEECHSNPLKTIDQNIKNTFNLANICLKKKVKNFVFASSLYVHSNSGSFYKVSKLSAEKYLEELSKLGLKILILRFGSLYGPRAGKNNSMYKIIRKILEKKEITYYGTGGEKREFLNVIDAARSTIELIDKNYVNKKITISGNEKLTYDDLFLLLSEVIEKKIRVFKKKRRSNSHYSFTPYNTSIEMNEKYIPNFNIDFGQGVTDYIEYLKNHKF